MTDDLWDRFRAAADACTAPSSGTRRRHRPRCCGRWPTPATSWTSTGTSTPPAGRWPAGGGAGRAVRHRRRRVLPERHDGPAGRAPGLVRPGRDPPGRDAGHRAPARPRAGRAAAAARLRGRAPHHRPPRWRPPRTSPRSPAGWAPYSSSCRCGTPGCALPTWEELTALSAAARERGVALHVDGARIWESQPFYDRPLHRDRGAGRQHVRLVLQGTRWAGRRRPGRARTTSSTRRRLWRSRMGGTIFRSTPEAVAAPGRPARPAAADGGVPGVGAGAGRRSCRRSGSPRTRSEPHTPTFQVLRRRGSPTRSTSG